jgi:hypothetical protein
LARIEEATRSLAEAMMAASVKIKVTMARPATTNARTAAPKPPTLSDALARPARIGPVQPKPASM